MKKKTPIPGEWQEEVNQWGGVRRYRMVGNVKEFETIVTTSYGDIPQSQLEAYNQRKKAARKEVEKNRKREEREQV